MIKSKGRDIIHIRMGISILVSGITGKRMAKELWSLKILRRFIVEIGRMGWSMEKVFIHFSQRMFTKVVGWRTSDKVTENTNGKEDNNTKVNGEIPKWTAKELFSLGMENNCMVPLKMMNFSAWNDENRDFKLILRACNFDNTPKKYLII